MHVAIQTFCRNRIIPIEASCSEECGAWNHHTFRHDALSALFGTGNIRGGGWNRTSDLADEAATLYQLSYPTALRHEIGQPRATHRLVTTSV